MINPDDIKAGMVIGITDALILRDAVKRLNALEVELLALRNATQCNHEWFTLHHGHTEAIYGCKLCGKYKSGRGSY